jgi:tetratricopeptide (TPR) repeat protein
VFRLVEAVVWKAQRRFGPAPTEVEYAMYRRAVLREAGRAYERNIETIVRAVRSAGVPLIVCTSVSISRDVFPFESVHRRGLTYAVRGEFLERHNRMRHLLMQGQVDPSIRTGKLALELDPSYAQAWYDLGHAYLAKGDTKNAAVCFHRARDEDTSGWRAPSRVNQFLRDLAASEGIVLADLEAAFQAHSPQGIINRKFFFDSIHFNAGGHRLAAEVIARRILSLDGLRAPAGGP